MPKKMCGENSKAAAARAIKAERLESERRRLEKEKEDAAWRDDDKNVARKQSRKEEMERKRLEALEKKKEREAILANEENILAKKAPQTKVTRAQIQAENQQREEAARARKKEEKVSAHLDAPLEENSNLAVAGTVAATNVDEAIAALRMEDDQKVEKHPEKRMKAAYEAFEKERLPELKAENGNMRLSQLKQILRKEWMKHPSNPFNQRLADLGNKQ